MLLLNTHAHSIKALKSKLISFGCEFMLWVVGFMLCPTIMCFVWDHLHSWIDPQIWSYKSFFGIKWDAYNIYSRTLKEPSLRLYLRLFHSFKSLSILFNLLPYKKQGYYIILKWSGTLMMRLQCGNIQWCYLPPRTPSTVPGL